MMIARGLRYQHAACEQHLALWNTVGGTCVAACALVFVLFTHTYHRSKRQLYASLASLAATPGDVVAKFSELPAVATRLRTAYAPPACAGFLLLFALMLAAAWLVVGIIFLFDMPSTAVADGGTRVCPDALYEFTRLTLTCLFASAVLGGACMCCCVMLQYVMHVFTDADVDSDDFLHS
jgi:hypothetical protein